VFSHTLLPLRLCRTFILVSWVTIDMSTAELHHDFVGENSLPGRYGIGGTAPAASSSLVWKTLLDRTLALLLLIPGLPLIGLLILLVRLTSRGPGLYSQVRVGKGRCRFLMYKLRSMRIDAEAGTGPVWSTVGADPRVTPLGYWLRRLHLDELPQLFNVLNGEMSLVGPRPERPEFVAVLAKEIPDYLERLQVPPGITGLAQVNLPPDSDLDSVRRKLVLDREYAASAGVFLDLRIMLATGLRVFGFPGRRFVQLLGLERTVTLEPWAKPIGGDASNVPATPHTISAAECRESAEPKQERRRAVAAPC
jgi:lipopolysaccharide/colanic/teichoic acid biosynthesis glycosyltransferase